MSTKATSGHSQATPATDCFYPLLLANCMSLAALLPDYSYLAIFTWINKKKLHAYLLTCVSSTLGVMQFQLVSLVARLLSAVVKIGISYTWHRGGLKDRDHETHLGRLFWIYHLPAALSQITRHIYSNI